ncbi:hypothetical protein CI109_104662 [Kwoniella shandongensis]|uniref:Uncharacterized protein n=1 Tax=Kwoniella shandongensis TaxID=1734106 RepID=A0A5M6BVE3_9TREE|nr:uncharacterized protein CI109_004828 [Kwoniella shandongensis]KAA5526828.1 hypothetical protein CI109_004828 [Kwoniella shandongensis]
MDYLSTTIDIAFLILALLLIPGSSFLHNHGHTNEANGNFQDHPTSPFTPTTPKSPPVPHFSHLSVPGVLPVPSITITPSHSFSHSHSDSHSLTQSSGDMSFHRPKPFLVGGHRRKVVSFSLSSLDEILSPSEHGGNSPISRRRPPTPFVRPPLGGGLQSPLTPYTESGTNSPVGSPLPSPGTVGGGGTQTASPSLSPVEMSHAPEGEDTMGVKKKWLMA